jgi:hypothetical protein
MPVLLIVYKQLYKPFASTTFDNPLVITLHSLRSLRLSLFVISQLSCKVYIVVGRMV